MNNIQLRQNLYILLLELKQEYPNNYYDNFIKYLQNLITDSKELYQSYLSLSFADAYLLFNYKKMLGANYENTFIENILNNSIKNQDELFSLEHMNLRNNLILISSDLMTYFTNNYERKQLLLCSINSDYIFDFSENHEAEKRDILNEYNLNMFENIYTIFLQKNKPEIGLDIITSNLIAIKKQNQQLYDTYMTDMTSGYEFLKTVPCDIIVKNYFQNIIDTKIKRLN